mmetsp:Transcript_132272/g.263925  ORF Transcript_132272/g.263925 Transcript_132272/m.263925 type:complete len:92 (+) Transcript_132272:464-739(+)
MSGVVAKLPASTEANKWRRSKRDDALAVRVDRKGNSSIKKEHLHHLANKVKSKQGNNRFRTCEEATIRARQLRSRSLKGAPTACPKGSTRN